ncbi:phosphate ABC transporter permease PstA [Pseudomonas aeruginosa]|uniref:phosphate ABC transporter permease PstA n=1 Tax=Pseudomonas aeruginosa TaxID=287 RepID=UPI0027C2B459|nr:phosphate ABC transporter permease PstA [Pseudomonas aeruginosa]MDQ2578906.1 phosphate ABC transporter permease PstA [Pseudomonas aeruginosa]MDQ2605599.1 phosphate ABC transporter permease PstA [Pseudomonas aeruginosa]MDT8189551.1 phosphate ABC transporter permease PstA [Pseudomonas aeruginosa]MDT8211627.1 phosphate ABC transporter permease PstA [Pseudomonas aeruginosa]HBP6530121.1 phosphate ABC transporter permease PstA [Pseudomonas aeruginosa]
MNLQERWRGHALASLALLLALAPLSLLLTLFVEGFSHLDWSFFSTAPEQAGRSGGIGPIIVSTLWVLLICLTITVPLGLGTALFLVEQLRPDSRANLALQWALDGLGAVPSVVFGLFGHRVFVVELGWGYSLLAGGCTLACMVLPLFIRGCEQALRDCPHSYRQAAAGLAISRVGYLRRILLPFAAPGIAAALVLSAGRALAETAVLLFTAGYVMRWPESVFDSGRTLAVHIYDLAMNVSGGSPASAATALVLLGLALIIQLLAWRLGRRPAAFAR